MTQNLWTHSKLFNNINTGGLFEQKKKIIKNIAQHLYSIYAHKKKKRKKKQNLQSKWSVNLNNFYYAHKVYI